MDKAAVSPTKKLSGNENSVLNNNTTNKAATNEDIQEPLQSVVLTFAFTKNINKSCYQTPSTSGAASSNIETGASNILPSSAATKGRDSEQRQQNAPTKNDSIAETRKAIAAIVMLQEEAENTQVTAETFFRICNEVLIQICQ